MNNVSQVRTYLSKKTKTISDLFRLMFLTYIVIFFLMGYYKTQVIENTVLFTGTMFVFSLVTFLLTILCANVKARLIYQSMIKLGYQVVSKEKGLYINQTGKSFIVTLRKDSLYILPNQAYYLYRNAQFEKVSSRVAKKNLNDLYVFHDDLLFIRPSGIKHINAISPLHKFINNKI